MSVVVRAARSDVLQARVLQLTPDAWDDFMAALSQPDSPAAAAREGLIIVQPGPP